MIREMADNQPLNFEDPIDIKRTPHTLSFRIYRVQVSPANEIYVMCDEWYRVRETDDMIINTLYQRLSFLKLKTA
jgi:hypothetical protein